MMNGGIVSDNRATNMGGGIAVVSAYEEIENGYGNLKSSAEILGGVIQKNSAKTGAGFLHPHIILLKHTEFAPQPQP